MFSVLFILLLIPSHVQYLVNVTHRRCLCTSYSVLMAGWRVIHYHLYCPPAVLGSTWLSRRRQRWLCTVAAVLYSLHPPSVSQPADYWVDTHHSPTTECVGAIPGRALANLAARKFLVHCGCLDIGHMGVWDGWMVTCHRTLGTGHACLCLWCVCGHWVARSHNDDRQSHFGHFSSCPDCQQLTLTCQEERSRRS